MPKKYQAQTIGELRASDYTPVSVKQEIRHNLISMIKAHREVFPGIIGYGDTVIPNVENAILSGHDIIFLGERGQAKSRLMRVLMQLLDEKIPAIKGCEINDDPFAPVCKHCRDMVAANGDKTEIVWLDREARYSEKLATPDIAMADLLGDIDPIKVAEGKYLSDELTIHYGLIPRTNRGIFCINELPDLAERLQVGLFNLLEERDVQIRGYRIRLPLDILLVASANPEDYTNRGRIISPLKDRFGSQVRTHYPLNIRDEITIVKQEHHEFAGTGVDTFIPAYMEEIIAEITQLCRKSADINQRSGVSVRVSIMNYETIISNAVRRAVTLGEKLAVPRISDLPYISASMGSKIELEGFEENKEGKIIEDLSHQAVLNIFNRHFSVSNLNSLIAQFSNGVNIETSDMMAAKKYIANTKEIAGLTDAVKKIAKTEQPEIIASAAEFILEGLYVNNKLNKTLASGKNIYRN
ncbi:MAG: magnesium chelatase [Dehalococcoidales bacterium]